MKRTRNKLVMMCMSILCVCANFVSGETWLEKHATDEFVKYVAQMTGVEQGWSKWLGDKGVFIGMSSFGASAPGKVCFEKFGITVEKAVAAAKKSIADSV